MTDSLAIERHHRKVVELSRPKGVSTAMSLSGPFGSAVWEPSAPIQVDRFVVTERIGRGGMGVVYSAHDPRLDRPIAIKFVLDFGRTEEEIARARRGLEREAKAAARLAHARVEDRYGDPLERHLVVERKFRAELGERHPDVAAEMNSIAMALEARGRSEEAIID